MPMSCILLTFNPQSFSFLYFSFKIKNPLKSPKSLIHFLAYALREEIHIQSYTGKHLHRL